MIFKLLHLHLLLHLLLKYLLMPLKLRLLLNMSKRAPLWQYGLLLLLSRLVSMASVYKQRG